MSNINKTLKIIEEKFNEFKKDTENLSKEQIEGAEFFLQDIFDALNKEKQKEIAEIEKDLRDIIDFDEWAAREYGEEKVDYNSTANNLYDAGYRKIIKD